MPVILDLFAIHCRRLRDALHLSCSGAQNRSGVRYTQHVTIGVAEPSYAHCSARQGKDADLVLGDVSIDIEVYALFAQGFDGRRHIGHAEPEYGVLMEALQPPKSPCFANARRSILRGHLIHMVDDQHRSRYFARFQPQAKLFAQCFENRDCTIRLGRHCVAPGIRSSEVRECRWRAEVYRHVISAIDPGCIYRRTVNIHQVKLSTGGDSFTGTFIIDVYDEVSLT